MRPTKYNQKIIGKSKKYLKGYSQPPYNQVIPSVVGLAVAINIRKSTVYKWIKEEDKEEFSDITERIKTTQEMLLKNYGLVSKFNSTITELLLSHHGVIEKTETALTGLGGDSLKAKVDLSLIPENILTKIINELECNK